MGPRARKTIHIFLSAGEASGDLHGASLVRALRERDTRVAVSCIGGPLLEAAGASVLVNNRDLAVVGIFEVLRCARTLYEAWRKIRSHLIADRPDAVVLIDFPDFNFLLGRLAKKLGIPVFYYISPQVWAWRRGRVRTLRRMVDAMAVILPFEADFYRRYGMKVHAVGHPLLDVLSTAPSRDEARTLYGSKEDVPLVGLLPGSRKSELRALLPILLDAAALIARQLPQASFLLPLAPTLEASAVEREIAARQIPVRIVSGDTYGVIRACDLVLTASGTVTLETAILGTPMIIVYKVSDLTYSVGHRLITVDWVGLPNLIAGRKIVPELLQKDARAELIAAEALGLLQSPDRLLTQRMELERIERRLGEPGVADRVAGLVLDLACRARKA